jgi:DNA-directed RNA polymerase subunit L/DNA-directed RNA polymerase alpha subunit
MHFSDITLNKNKLAFKILNLDTSIVNGIRRIILSEIPNVAFYFDPYDMNRRDIIVHKNTGVLHNEFIAQRISLLPIYFTENEVFDYKDNEYKFILKKKNNTIDTINITTHDFIIQKNDKVIKNEILFPKNEITGDHILITKLKPNIYNPEKGDELDIECLASKNIAKFHTRWCPVSKCSYHNIIDESKCEKALKEKLKDLDSEESKQIIIRKFNTLDKYRFFKTNKYDEPNEFQFEIESECRLRPIYIVFKAFTIIIDKITLLISNIDKLSITNIKSIPNMYQIEIINEDFTLLNIMQSLIYNYNFREIGNNYLEYIGFNQTHPLDNKMILKLKFINDTDVKTFLIENLTRISDNIKEFTIEWINITQLNKLNIKEVDTFIG